MRYPRASPSVRVCGAVPRRLASSVYYRKLVCSCRGYAGAGGAAVGRKQTWYLLPGVGTKSTDLKTVGTHVLASRAGFRVRSSNDPSEDEGRKAIKQTNPKQEVTADKLSADRE
jgi:hypothetical protein